MGQVATRSVDALAATSEATLVPGTTGQGLFVVGMHRSGTSAAARVVNLLGVPTCRPADLLDSRGANERGHWESRTMLAENERILRLAQCAWWCPHEPNRFVDVLASLESEESVGRTAFRSAHPTGQWLWKDPRLCLLLPFWLRALPEARAVVMILRDPAEVMASLHKRNKIVPSWSAAIWERYTRSMLHNVAGQPTYVCSYSDLLNDRDQTISDLAGFLVGAGFATIPGARAAIDRFLEPSLRHHRADQDGPPIHPAARRLHESALAVRGVHAEFPVLDVGEESSGCRTEMTFHHERWRGLTLPSPRRQSTTQEDRAMTAIEIPPGWRQWLARNLLGQLPQGALVDIMASNGLDRHAAEQAADALGADPTYLAAQQVARDARKLESIMAIRTQLAALAGSGLAVERRREVDRGEFLSRYYARNEPVVLLDLTDHWAARDLWSLEYLQSQLADTLVEVMTGRDSDPAYERRAPAHRVNIPFTEYADFVKLSDGSNDQYLTANNNLLDNESAKSLWADFDSPRQLCDPQNESGRVFLWIGPGGTITPLHHDVMNVLLTQVVGWKRVTLFDPLQTPYLYNDLGVFSQVDPIAPDYARFPKFTNAHAREVVLGPGDALFIPAGWWHHVVALETSVSLSFTNFVWPNDFEWNNPE